MLKPFEVHVPAEPLTRFEHELDEQGWNALRTLAQQTQARMAGRTFWNISSTARGGGVAEMLPRLIAYARGTGVDARWLVLTGTPEFFHITKRLHHALHGSPGDGSGLGTSEHDCYDEVLRDNAEEILVLVKPGDVILLHDPQTVGLGPALSSAGAHVAWRCHIGRDTPNAEVERAWEFLAPGLAAARLTVFSRAAYAPPQCAGRALVIQPSIDIFAVKNQPMAPEVARAILATTGLLRETPDTAAPVFTRADGVTGRVSRGVDVIRLGAGPAAEVPLVVQVSRWDPLKDPAGVLLGFARMLRKAPHVHAELVLAGPAVTSVADDPDAAATLEDVHALWRQQSRFVRQHVHLACLPMADSEENAAIVNALQRHASVVTQKSLQEGFGLTLTEAMWKQRAVVASAVGGLQDQVVHGENGLLVRNAGDPEEFAGAVRSLLEDPARAAALGRRARETVRARFTAPRHLTDLARLIERLDAR
ncbi:glycosyltransferase [Myxococcus fulvus]|uniref:glycosyltransferase n=1 Tax=Myxococcus fulvus TaxID=33 RepID=UPI0020C11844|nr:glycosyltransferase [Myxococcus fulvus]MCK8502407.1 glycosyltransferase [Myxococcus fulvus]